MKYALIGCGRIAVNHIKAALNNKPSRHRRRVRCPAGEDGSPAGQV